MAHEQREEIVARSATRFRPLVLFGMNLVFNHAATVRSGFEDRHDDGRSVMPDLWRSLLSVAADDHARIEQLADCGADAFVLDLEDAVPVHRKAVARNGLPSAVAVLAARSRPAVLRINGGWRSAIADLDAGISAGVSAIIVSRVECAARLIALSQISAEFAREINAPPPPLIPTIASPAALPLLDEIAAVEGVIGLALETDSFSLVLGVPSTPEALDVPCRMLALAASRRRLMALGVPTSMATVEDEATCKAAVARARAMGLTGALCMHPHHVALVNCGFGPTSDEIRDAASVIAAWHAAGECGVIKVGGRTVDQPVYLAACRVMAMAGSLEARAS